MIKLRKRRKEFSTLSTKEAAEIVANNKKEWKPVIDLHKNNRECPECLSKQTLYNSNNTRKCINCNNIYEIWKNQNV